MSQRNTHIMNHIWMILAEALFWLKPSIKVRNFMTGNQ